MPSEPPACERCGDPVDNRDNCGWWRETCTDCQAAIAAEVEPGEPIEVDESEFGVPADAE